MRAKGRLQPLRGLVWKVRDLILRAGRWLRRFWPSEGVRKWGIRGARVTYLLLMAVMGALMLRTGLGRVPDALIGGLVGAAVLTGATLGIQWGLEILRRLPVRFTAAVAGLYVAGGLLLDVGPSLGTPGRAALILLPVALWGSAAAVTTPGFGQRSLPVRVGILLVGLAGLAGHAGGAVWLLSDGRPVDLLEVDLTGLPLPETLDAPDPGTSGPYAVAYLTYGSGEDRRPEFGAEADFTTPSIDGEPFVSKLSGWRGKLRKAYWGFDRTAFPLNGRVWYPEGAGPFPLVLIVHGNHAMREVSDPGYGYLGEHLASRGFILVSVDENFLNGDWTDNYGTENDARAWVLLEHLRQWRAWQQEEGHPFRGKADMSRIALIGHSRGGEAVAIAAAFNRLSRYPDDAEVRFDYGFDLRGVAAIAPVDGQYEPADQPTPVRDVDYLLLHGSHDGDVSSLSGDRQYKRIRFTDGTYRFKSMLYIYRANHGQFNTVWGDSDWGMPGGLLLNRAELMDSEDQRLIARVAIGAFLETVLHEDERYLPLFRDWRRGRHWLPDTHYVGRFDDVRTRLVADFSEDVDVTTGSLEGVRLSGQGLTDWREGDLGFRGGRGDRGNQVVTLGWRLEDAAGDSAAPDTAATQVPIYSVSFNGDLLRSLGVDAGSDLLFALAASADEPDRPDREEADEQGTGEQGQQEGPLPPIDLTVEVEDDRGRIASFPLSAVRPLLPPLTATFTRLERLEERYRSASQPVLQSFRIPLARFEEQLPGFAPASLRAVRFRFDRTPKGLIHLDEIGFSAGEGGGSSP